MDNNSNNNSQTEKKSIAKAFAEGWKRLPAGRKALMIAGLALSVAVIVLAALSLTGVWENSGMLYIPLMGVLMFTQAAQVWSINKKTAVFSLIAGLVVIIIWLIGMFF